MSRKRPRGLTPEEQSLWDRVRQRATPMHPERKPPKQAMSEQVARPRPAPAAEPIPPFRIGEKRGDVALPRDLGATAPEGLSRQPLRMDRKTHGRVTRGKKRPEARLDLHGMTLDRAHPALTRFILDSQARGRRLVLVITGKGKDRDDGGPMPVRRGVLRHQVPQWLSVPPLSQAVLQVIQAHVRHGGQGAYYVYLRKPT